MFCEYEEDYYGNLKVKGDSYCYSYGDIELNEKPNDLDFNSSGMYDEKQLYAVYENKDVEKVIELLKKCLNK